MPRKMVEGIIATTHQIAAYGGWKLTAENLQALQRAVEDKTVIWRSQHDVRLPVDTNVIRSEIRPTEDGESELYVQLDVDEEDWASGGDLRGFSFTILGTFLPASENKDTPRIRIFADAANYEDELIELAAAELQSAFSVEAGRVYQFSILPPPLIVLDIPWDVVAQIAQGAVGSLIAAALIVLVRGRRSTTPSIVNIKVTRGDASVQARIETADEETIRKAVDKIPNLDLNARYQTFDEESEEWRGPGYL